MFVGWEGVGLCSYLLIGFWYEKDSASNAGKKAFVVNRWVTLDSFLGCSLLFIHFGSLDFTDIFGALQKNPQLINTATATTITILLFVGACGKSAQIPIYVWLPDAMEGPTPVSSLIHAATMVTAGSIWSPVQRALQHGAHRHDGRGHRRRRNRHFHGFHWVLSERHQKVLAYSTISQLGYMFLGVGVGAFSAGIFHLMTHAFFKGLLFLGAGSIMHALSGELDMRKMGALRKKIPYTFWTFFIATLAIAGIPGLSGFFSKDEILWQAFSSSQGHWLLWAVAAVAAA